MCAPPSATPVCLMNVASCVTSLASGFGLAGVGGGGTTCFVVDAGGVTVPRALPPPATAVVALDPAVFVAVSVVEEAC